MESQSGDKIKDLGERQNLCLQQGFPLLKMDTALNLQNSTGRRKVSNQQVTEIPGHKYLHKLCLINENARSGIKRITPDALNMLNKKTEK